MGKKEKQHEEIICAAQVSAGQGQREKNKKKPGLSMHTFKHPVDVVIYPKGKIMSRVLECMGRGKVNLKFDEATNGFGSCSRNDGILMSRSPHFPISDMTFFRNGDESSLF